MFRILIVDDETPIREWLVHTICSNRPDYLTESAKNGLEALEKCKTVSYDLIVMDIRMPHMNGLELLEALYELCPDTTAIVLSSYDDYNYVRNAFKYHAVDYLLKAEIDSQKLLTAVDNYYTKKNTVQNPSDLAAKLKDFLSCANSPCSENREASPGLDSDLGFQEMFSSFSQYMPQNPYFCFLLKMPGNAGFAKPYLPIAEDVHQAFCLPVDDNIFLACFGLATQTSLLYLMQTQAMYLNKLQTYNSFSLLIYSEIFYTKENLPPCLRYLYAQRDLDFYGIHYGRVQPVPESLCLQMNKRYIDIVEQIQNRHYEEVLLQSEALLQFAEEVRYPDVDSLKLLCAKLCESACLSSCRLNLSDYHDYAQNLSPRLTASGSIAQLRQLLFAHLRSFHSQPDSGNSFLLNRISRAAAFMEEHYMDNISLASVADELHISPEYLSRTFKKQTGTNFNNYLNNIRLQHALELLKDYGLPISEIAMQTGFQSPAYFSKCFKSAFGLSPQQWKASRIAEK